MRKLIIFLFIGFFVASCGMSKEMRHANKGVKRLNKLLVKHPELKRDTIIKATVIYVKGESTNDTLIIYDIDTVWTDTGDVEYIVHHIPEHLEYDKEGVKVSLDRVGNGYKLTVLQKLDSVFIETETKVPYIGPTVYKKAPQTKFQKFMQNSGWTLWILVLILIVIVILKILGKLTIPIKIG